MQVNNIIKNLESHKLTLQDFTDNITDAEKFLENGQLIGSGAVGRVYLIGDKVVKVVLPCEANPSSALYQYCLDLQDKIQLIPGGNGKKRYMLPNLLNEIINGMILGEMKQSIGFTRTLNSHVVDKSRVYITMDAHKPVTMNENVSPNELVSPNNEEKRLSLSLDSKKFIYFLFQICHALMTAQEKHRFTHYDLHVENILWNDWPEDKKYISYPLPGKDQRLIIPQVFCPFLLKISDFALARMETKRTLITPIVDDFPEKTYGEFSPSYDIISLIGTILIDNKYRVAFSTLFDNLDIYKFMLIFSLWVLNDKDILPRVAKREDKLNNREDLDAIRDLIAEKYFTPIAGNKYNFRPKREGDFVKYNNVKPMVSIVNFLGKVLELKKYALVSNVKTDKVLYLPRLPKYKKYADVIPYSPEIQLKSTPKSGETISEYKEMVLDKYLKVRTYNILINSPPDAYNFTVEQKQFDQCPLQEHYLTALFVDKDYFNKYAFGYDCCKIDPINYLLNKNKEGFVINGSFFAIKDDYLPIGTYKDKHNFINKYLVPDNYRDVFRYVVLKDGKIKLEKEWNGEKVFTAGPLLIESGKIVYDPYDNKFHCTDARNAEGTVLSLTEDSITTSGYYKYISEDGFTCAKEFVNDVQTYPRCDKIQPGELSHANNPNPRSALAILKDGSYIFFTVEGRSKRGVGMDLYNMSKYILDNFNVKDMINLDGGRSSNMAWKKGDKVYLSNTERIYPYPVGNILYLLKKDLF